jgi:hypothetical protein
MVPDVHYSELCLYSDIEHFEIRHWTKDNWPFDFSRVQTPALQFAAFISNVLAYNRFSNYHLVEKYGSVAILHSSNSYLENKGAKVKYCRCEHFKNMLCWMVTFILQMWLNYWIVKCLKLSESCAFDFQSTFICSYQAAKWLVFQYMDMLTHMSLFFEGSVLMRSAADLRLSTGTDTVERVWVQRVAHFARGKKRTLLLKYRIWIIPTMT